MKKLLAIAIVSMVSLSYLLAHHGQRDQTISINNQSGVTVVVTDTNNHKITVNSNQTAQMRVTFNQPSGHIRFLRHKDTTITVTDPRNNNSSSISIDEDTRTVTIEKDLKLTAN